ncbi:MAG: 50S ribosomal protein L28 [Minisyncoccia bacterium]|jgi:ribosomal protein L28
MTKCPICGKKPVMANKRKLLRGNYNIVNRYKKYPNLQWARVDGKRIKICTSCLKAQAKVAKT